MPTPSLIRYTLRNVAETGLFIEDMGSVGFSVNVIDPNLGPKAHDRILQVRINSAALKWGG